jgi:hypothetical protein
LNKKNVTKDGVDGSGVSISTAGTNATGEGMEASVAQWAMTGASVAEAAASGTSTTESYGS